MLHLVSGINFLVLSVNLIPVPVSLSYLYAPTTSYHPLNSPLSLFHSPLKTYFFYKSFSP